MKANFEHPTDLVSAALQHLTKDEFKRIDGLLIWQKEKWEFAAYKMNDISRTIRIDLRKK